MKKFKNCFIFGLVINLLCLPAFTLTLDTSANARKNYTPSKFETDEALPSMPKITDPVFTSTYVKPQHHISVTSEADTVLSTQKSYISIKKGTKIKLKLLNNISDKTNKGTRINFVSIFPVTTSYYTIPAGTIFKGSIIDSHPPQFSANGGLIVIVIDTVILNDSVQPIGAYVSKANGKMIFKNNIKGKRMYIASVFDSTGHGYRFFKRMCGVTRDFAQHGYSIILSPFSLILGVVVWGANIMISPALAMAYKGKNIYIDKGAIFEIKLLHDSYIYN